MKQRTLIFLKLGMAFFSTQTALTALAETCSLPGGTESIQIKRNTFTGPRDFLGAAQIPATLVPRRDGCFVHYAGGSIYWSQRTPAVEVHGDIRHRWSQEGWETGELGYPITDETTTPDGVGRFNHFEGGSIYWKPNLGPLVVKGAIRQFWASLGWERNADLGYPTSEEFVPFPGSPNQVQKFENGVLYFMADKGKVYDLAANPFLSRSADQMEAELQKTISQFLASSGVEARIEGAVRIAAVEDYVRGPGRGALERTAVVTATIKYKAEFLGLDGIMPDPTTKLTLRMRFSGKRGYDKSAIVYRLNSYQPSTHVAFPTSAAISASEINAILAGHLNPLLGVETEVAEIPSSFNLLHAGLAKDGALKTYTQPL
jgi:hypothetical protein